MYDEHLNVIIQYNNDNKTIEIKKNRMMTHFAKDSETFKKKICSFT